MLRARVASERRLQLACPSLGNFDYLDEDKRSIREAPSFVRFLMNAWIWLGDVYRLLSGGWNEIGRGNDDYTKSQVWDEALEMLDDALRRRIGRRVPRNAPLRLY